MSRIWFATELETVAGFWRVARRDGVTLGFTTHDADLWFDGLLHRAAPGITPARIRRSADLADDEAEVEGVLSHDSISAGDLALGRFDGASVTLGLVDWQTLEHQLLYRGTLGTVTQDSGSFSAQLVSAKAELNRDCVPRTSPCCRAVFCGPGCGLSPARFTHRAVLADADPATNRLLLATGAPLSQLVGGRLRWLDGPLAGMGADIVSLDGDRLMIATPLDGELAAGLAVELREGCDRTLASCASRFGNAINFQAEPFLPGNDLIVRYPTL